MILIYNKINKNIIEHYKLCKIYSLSLNLNQIIENLLSNIINLQKYYEFELQ